MGAIIRKIAIKIENHETLFVACFQRCFQILGFKVYLCPPTYFKSASGIAASEEPTQFDPTSPGYQRWVFIVKLVLTLAAIEAALLVEFGPKAPLPDIIPNLGKPSVLECFVPGQADVEAEKEFTVLPRKRYLHAGKK
ncbi:MAG: hypothetical protein SW833_02100 [Cyanobacteriota bacterium]|nr:hypothetical protein [Cyanobacteriota bacterium]